MKKIVKGNDFTMKIPVSKYDQDQLVNYSLPGCTDIEVSLISGLGKRYQLTYNIGVDDDYVLYAHVTASEIPLGSYSLEVKGKKYGISWRSNEYEQIQMVDYNKDGDTAFEPDEGDDSVEMNTAIVILSRDVDQLHDSISQIVSDLDNLKFDTSISPTNYYSKVQINEFNSEINSSISDISNNLNDISINVNDISTRLNTDYLKKNDFNSSYIELNDKIENVSVGDITEQLNPINNSIQTLSEKDNDIDSSISDISTRLKNDYIGKTLFDSSYKELSDKLKTVDITEQLNPINNSIQTLTQKDNDIDSSISDISTRLKNDYIEKTLFDSSYNQLEKKIKNASLDELDYHITLVETNLNTYVSKTENLQNSFDNLIGTDQKNGTIDTFTDVKKFFANISDSSTLSELLKDNTGSGNVDLSNYVTKPMHNSAIISLNSRIDATNSSINLYILEHDISTNEIKNNISDLSTKLDSSYYNKDDINNKLKYYVSLTQYNEHNTTIEDRFNNYTKTYELETAIENYGFIKSTDVDSKITTALTDYIKSTDVDSKITTALTDYIKSTDVDSKITAALTDYKKVKVITESEYNDLVSAGTVNNDIVYMIYTN